MREPKFWYQSNGLSSTLLAPLGRLYYSVGVCRRLITRPLTLDCPVICVGNATIGGAGKTPVTDLLATTLAQAGYRPAILSRGYGGSLSGPVRVSDTHQAIDVGDEPCLLAQRHPVYIGADRRETARHALAEGHDLLLLDDGYQNPALSYDLRILVVDGLRGFGNGRLIPAGPLREPWRNAVARADIVVVNHGQPTPDLVDVCDRRQIPLVVAHIQPKAPQPKPVYAYCGIANPDKFTRSLDEAGYDIRGTWFFDDHYAYSEMDARMLIGEASKRDARLITTEKDASRLKGAGGLRQALLSASDVFEIQLSTEPDLTAAVQHALSRL